MSARILRASSKLTALALSLTAGATLTACSSDQGWTSSDDDQTWQNHRDSNYADRMNTTPRDPNGRPINDGYAGNRDNRNGANPNGNYPNSGYPNNGNYPNNQYPNNGNYPNNNYPNNGSYPSNQYPNSGNYPNNGNYPNTGPNNNNNGWPNNGTSPGTGSPRSSSGSSMNSGNAATMASANAAGASATTVGWYDPATGRYDAQAPRGSANWYNVNTGNVDGPSQAAAMQSNSTSYNPATGKYETRTYPAVTGVNHSSASGPSSNVNPGFTPSAMDSDVTPDVRVLSTLHVKNQKEIEFGKLAQANSSDEQVRAYATQLVKDHTESDEQVVSTARSQNLTLLDADRVRSWHRSDKAMSADRGDRQANAATVGDAANMNESTSDPMTELKALRGAEFDRRFAQASVKMHREAINMLEEAQPLLQNQSVKALVSNVLPKLRAHESKAQALLNKTGMSGRTP